MQLLCRSALRIACMAAVLSATPRPALAQLLPAWGKIDTVTTGACDDFNPVIQHTSGVYGVSDFVYLLFERRTDAEYRIVSRRYDPAAAAWDTGEVVVSSSPLASPQVKPAYASMVYGPPRRLEHIAVWQRWQDLRWQLYYSTLVDSAASWSQPAVLVVDSVDNTDVCVQHLADSTFLVAWKRGNVIAGVRMTPQAVSPPETLGVSSTPDFEFDMGSRDGFSATLVWTSSVNDGAVAVWRTVSSVPSFLVGPETLRTQEPCFNPHMCLGPYSGPEFMYESPVSGSLQVLYNLGTYQSGWVTTDPGVDHRNARSFTSPIVIKPVAGSAVAYFPMSVVVYETASPGDSSLVFAQNSGPADTVRAPGHNRNVCLGSQWIQTNSGNNLLAVWEGNRTGRSHIYSRLVPFYVNGITPLPAPPAAIQLRQNYPNPFNPSTTISYVLPARSHATLTLYTALGQRVATLVDAVQDAGEYHLRLDGARLASGLYFYRFAAGDAAITRRLVLVRR